VIKDPETGEVMELRCTYDPKTRGGDSPDGRKVKATLHWVSAQHSLPAEVRLYDRLFLEEHPESGNDDHDYKKCINPDSLQALTECRVEASLSGAVPGSSYQFERQGYFCVDSKDSSENLLVFNRTEGLRDSWAKIEKKQKNK
jgi:glutaminyl-tRNA synthetase